ncbi:heat shock protein DnaJ [Halovivax asiaticus JCM 14624]|uniref:Heat shock protein DnaJ n=1 Tax=Halovivax asiaticus JCM 14624 TaxID=1227490 RepID=M0BV92_9EURY|nr:DnaJ domain-containing protein [Halovivax asiaticus]ELZ13564.1 heat shock protein DnaJ [Halovivax asiaticus JCM 14624]
MGQSYYDVLGVASDASTNAIERAYRERVLETHPDHNDDPDATAEFTTVTTAADVLTDETERARYDRLGHAAYTGAADLGRATADPTNAAGSHPDSNHGDSTQGDTATNADPSGATGNGHWPDEEWWDRYSTGTTDDTDRSGPSHHARQRARRQRARTSRQTTDWPFDRTGTDSTSVGGGNPAGDVRSGGDTSFVGDTASAGEAEATTSNRTHSDSQARSARRSARDEATGDRSVTNRSASSSDYVVSQWDDDIAVDRSLGPIDGTTLVVGGGIASIYPFLVYASVTPAFSWLVNLLVACCTLVLVGYLLTVPRIALVTFGGWGLLVSAWFGLTGAISPFAPIALVAQAGFWIPFGYATAVWWVLRQ